MGEVDFLATCFSQWNVNRNDCYRDRFEEQHVFLLAPLGASVLCPLSLDPECNTWSRATLDDPQTNEQENKCVFLCHWVELVVMQHYYGNNWLIHRHCQAKVCRSWARVDVFIWRSNPVLFWHMELNRTRHLHQRTEDQRLPTNGLKTKKLTRVWK